jgi:DNA invertase Pin-like site-specific DNA recombinase
LAGKAYGYLRVSKDEQARSGLGLEAQRAAIEAAARRHGLGLVDVFVDGGFDGALDAAERPGLAAALAAVGRKDVLLVAKRDRLGRDPVETAVIERDLVRRKARVLSAAGEGTEGDEPHDLLLRRMIDAFAEWEKRRIRDRTRDALRAKKARRERYGAIPFGMQLASDQKSLEECPDERKIVDAVVALRAEGHSLRKIVEELRAGGVVSPRSGRPLQLRQVARIVRAHGPIDPKGP